MRILIDMPIIFLFQDPRLLGLEYRKLLIKGVFSFQREILPFRVVQFTHRPKLPCMALCHDMLNSHTQDSNGVHPRPKQTIAHYLKPNLDNFTMSLDDSNAQKQDPTVLVLRYAGMDGYKTMHCERQAYPQW